MDKDEYIYFSNSVFFLSECMLHWLLETYRCPQNKKKNPYEILQFLVFNVIFKHSQR